MKFSNFLFPESKTPDTDFEVVNDALKEAELSQQQESLSTELSNPCHTLEHSLIFGSPETVCEKIEEIEKIGVGGLIIHFRLGPMSWEDNERSLRLFAEKVLPEFRATAKSSAEPLQGRQ